MSTDLRTNPSPPPAQPVDLNRVELGRMLKDHGDEVGAIVDGTEPGRDPRRSRFGSSI